MQNSISAIDKNDDEKEYMTQIRKEEIEIPS